MKIISSKLILNILLLNTRANQSIPKVEAFIIPSYTTVEVRNVGVSQAH